MTHYDVRLHTDKGVEIHNKGIESDQKGVPGKLACVVLDYLKSAPYPGVIKAHVIDGKRYTWNTHSCWRTTLYTCISM